MLFAASFAPAPALADTSTNSAAVERVADDYTCYEYSKFDEFDMAKATSRAGRVWTDKSVHDEKFEYNDGTVALDTATEDFLVQLSAISSKSIFNLYEAQPLDIVLVMDSSDSMADNVTITGTTKKKYEVMQEAANSFLDAVLASNNKVTGGEDELTRVEIIEFNNQASVEHEMSALTDGNISDCKRVVSGITSWLLASQGTDRALKLASEELSSNGRANAKKIVIVMSDGAPTLGLTQGTAVQYAKVLKDADVEVYTLNVSDSADASDISGTNNKFMNAISSNYPNAEPTKTLGVISGYTLGSGSNQGYYKTASTSGELANIVSESAVFSKVKSESAVTQVPDGEDASSSGYVTFTDTLGSYMEVKAMKAVVYEDKVYEFKGTVVTSTEGSEEIYTFQNQAIGNGNLNQIKITVTKGTAAATGDTITVQIPASTLPTHMYTVDQQAVGLDSYDYNEEYTLPICVYYSVGVKDATESGYTDLIEQLLYTGDAAMKSYVAANTNAASGQVYFYSNAYDKQAAAAEGTTIATFTPAATNLFYYFQEDTPLYTDATCTTRLTSAPADGQSYYYTLPYYLGQDVQGDTTATKDEEFVEIEGSELLALQSSVKQNASGAYYIQAGTSRTSFVDELYSEKSDETNKTATATWVLSPSFAAGATSVTHLAGNNGRLAYAYTADLKITKVTSAATGHTIPSNIANRTFTVSVTLKDANGTALTGSYAYQIYDKDGNKKETTGANGNIANGGTVELANGDYVIVSGLPDGTQYAISESSSNLGNNWKNINTDDELKGSVTAGATSSVTVKNEYAAKSVTTGDDTPAKNFLKVIKEFKKDSVSGDSAWEEVSNPSFEFRLEAVSTTAVGLDASTMPMPNSADAAGAVTGTTLRGLRYVSKTVTSQNEATVDFGNITFDRPGTYTYEMYEQQPSSGAIPGVLYSGEKYRVVIEVADTDGDGQLEIVQTPSDRSEIHSAMYAIADLNGVSIESPSSLIDMNDPVGITNLYQEGTATIRLEGDKFYYAYGDLTNPDAGAFSFTISKATEAQLNDITDANKGTYANTPEPKNMSGNTVSTVTNGEDGGIGFGMLTFNSNSGDFANADMAVVNYYYYISEVVGTATGMSYDKTLYRVKANVQKTTEQTGVVTMDTEVTYEKSTDNGSTWSDANGIEFTNKKTANRLELSNGFDIQKTLTGRDGIKGESFTFTATLTGGTAGGVQSDEDGTKVYSIGDTVGTTTIDAYNAAGTCVLKNGQAYAENIAEGITFTKPGIYTFAVKETQGSAVAMSYDTHEATITIKVVDKDGQLTTEELTSYSNAGAPSAADAKLTDRAAFTNTYAGQTVTGEDLTLQLTKAMSGRDAAIGEFTFKVEGATCPDGFTGEKATAAEATAELSGGVAYEISNSSVISDGDTSTLTLGKLFSFTDADLTDTSTSKMFAYTVSEVIPDGAKDNGDGTYTYNSITYDGASYPFYVVLSWDATAGLTMTIQSTEAGHSGTVYNLATFNNSYKYSATTLNLDDPSAGGFTFAKVLKSSAWADSQTFKAAVIAKSYTGAANITTDMMPMPSEVGTDGTVTIAKASDGSNVLEENGNVSTAVSYSLGTITFEHPGTYVYELAELGADGTPGGGGTDANGIAYDANIGTLTVVVEDKGTGSLVATASVSGLALDMFGDEDTDAYAFENENTATLDVATLLDLRIVNTLTGKDAAAGDFKFTVEPVASEELESLTGVTGEEQKRIIAELFGLVTGTDAYSMGAAADGESAALSVFKADGNGVALTGAAAGQTFSFIVSETSTPTPEATSATSGGYTHANKSTQYRVDIKIVMDEAGKLAAEVYVDSALKMTIGSDATEAATVDLSYASSYAEPNPTSEPSSPADSDNPSGGGGSTGGDSTDKLAATGDATVPFAAAALAVVGVALAAAGCAIRKIKVN